jgi:hypothetical protein
MTVEVSIPKYIPAYNNRYVVLSSTNDSEARFKYVVQIMDGSTEVARINQPPDPNGNGVIELSNVLKNFVRLEPNMLLTGSDNGGNHFFNYSLRYGEQYVDTWQANDFIFSAGNIALTTDTFTDTTHDYSEGDLINVNSPDEDFVLSGVYRVISVPDNKTVVINQPWIQSGAAINIDTQYTDQRVTEFLNIESQTDRYVYDARLLFDENAAYNENTYKIGTTNGRMLTKLQTLSGDIPMYIGDRFTANYFGTLAGDMKLEVQRLGAVIVGTTIDITNHKGTVRIDRDAIHPTLALVVGDRYRVRVVNNTTTNTSPYINFVVREVCTKFTNKRLIWMDRFGAWNSFNFELHSTKDLGVNRTVYERENLGGFSGGSYSIDTSQFGDLVTKVNSNEVFTVNSNRVTQNQIFMLEDLFTSRYVYEFTDGKLIPVILLTNDYQISSLLHDRMRTITVQYRHSNVEVR